LITFTGQNTPPVGNVEGAIVAGSRNYVNTYDYDANGNMITRSLPGGPTWTYVYDEANRLESVSGVVSATFTYDGDGNRVKATVGVTTTIRIGGYYEKTGGVVTKYYYHAGQRAPRRRGAMRQDGALYWLLTDHLGSTSVVVNAAGTNIESEIRYRPWGEIGYQSGAVPTDRLFTGQRYDSALGLYDYNARWYDPWMGAGIVFDPRSSSPTPAIRRQ